jgi:hypothetical protein
VRSALVGAAVLVACAVAAYVPVQSEARAGSAGSRPEPRVVDAPKPARELSLLFVHHSVGAQLLADPGPGDGVRRHENGGGLRSLLESSGYRVHGATYGSRLGERTDLFDWPDKFTRHMDELLTTADGSSPMRGGARHDVVLFKSCFPNNGFDSTGTAPGTPRGPELSVENAKAALRSLLPEFRKHPNVLFVYLTAPPLAPKTPPEPLWKWAAKSLLGRSSEQRLTAQAQLAGQFNAWVVGERGWLDGYPLKNVAVVDYQQMLANDQHLLVYPTGDGSDSHPSSEGQLRAAPLVLAALNRAVATAGIDRPLGSEPATNSRE